MYDNAGCYKKHLGYTVGQGGWFLKVVKNFLSTILTVIYIYVSYEYFLKCDSEGNDEGEAHDRAYVNSMKGFSGSSHINVDMIEQFNIIHIILLYSTKVYLNIP